MLKQLKKSFPSIQAYEELDGSHADYEWYVTNNGEIIGILKSELTNKDKTILSAFLQPYQTTFPQQTRKESEWRRLILHPNGQDISDFDRNYRFVYFHIESDQIDPITFKEAIDELFGKEMAILWETESEGIIIEEHDEIDEPIAYPQIIDVLVSDLYVKINFYVGQFQSSIKHVKQYYDAIVEGAKIAVKYIKLPVTTYLDMIPYTLLDQTEQGTREKIAMTVLKEFRNDQETLHMIETFINCNLNVSVTAQELYLHRNSLQYRLDKFIEKTNIDIRQFHAAMAVYLALLAYKSL